MTLHYHGPKYGYVDSSDRGELAAIALEIEGTVRAGRLRWRLTEPLTDAEAYRLVRARRRVDALVERAELRRKGWSLVKVGVPGHYLLAVAK